MLRETIGRIVNRPNDDNLYFIKISKESLADASFFNWIRKMMTGLEKRSPGRQIAIELSTEDIKPVQKQAGALISYL